MRSSPGSLRPASRLRWRASLPARWAAAAFRSCSETSASSARESVIRAALFAARCRASLWQSEDEPWRERPRCARPTCPRACPEGSLTPSLSLSLEVVGHSMFGGENRRVFAASNALDGDSDLPEDPVAFVRKMLPANWSRSRVLPGQLLSRNIVARARRIRCRLAVVR